ncbi:hypothetical protein V1477_018724 [Vespula maculifrons]|uniref:Uncharacterized protein n=1 Tax=Vespula maculifrons TaxID=7453 RepID=A0ABD2AW64_VESMC
MQSIQASSIILNFRTSSDYVHISNCFYFLIFKLQLNYYLNQILYTTLLLMWIVEISLYIIRITTLNLKNAVTLC